MSQVVKIYVARMYESCERTTFFVTLKTDEGMEKTPDSFCTGSVYTDHVGLSVEEARDRALIMADQWGDFLNIHVEPYVEDGATYTPSMRLDTYTNERLCRSKR